MVSGCVSEYSPGSISATASGASSTGSEIGVGRDSTLAENSYATSSSSFSLANTSCSANASVTSTNGSETSTNGSTTSATGSASFSASGATSWEWEIVSASRCATAADKINMDTAWLAETDSNYSTQD